MHTCHYGNESSLAAAGPVHNPPNTADRYKVARAGIYIKSNHEIADVVTAVASCVSSNLFIPAHFFGKITAAVKKTLKRLATREKGILLVGVGCSLSFPRSGLYK